ncbi:MAG: glycosyltransferase, partial [Pirellulales bacterium]|nr:glycosyltransferase [Pirellulales bacterium]
MQTMVKICHVQVLPLMSGVQRSMLEIFKQLDRRVFEPWVVCQGEGELTDELGRQGVPYICVPQLQRPIRPVHDVRAYRALKRVFAEHRFDLVHTHSSKPGILARAAARKAGVPHVIHHVRGFAWHEFSPTYQRVVYGALERWAGRYCDQVIFVNHEEREMAIDRRILPRDKCSTIYNGVDFDHFEANRAEQARQAFRSQHSIGPDEVAITVVGRLDEQKQSMILPEIVHELHERCRDRQWSLLVAGSGPLEAPLAG